jgi:hypothetical protein
MRADRAVIADHVPVPVGDVGGLGVNTDQPRGDALVNVKAKEVLVPFADDTVVPRVWGKSGLR